MADNCYHPMGRQGTKKIGSDAKAIAKKEESSLVNKRQSAAEVLKNGLSVPKSKSRK